MRFSRFFIDRPVFAAVISIIIVLLGAFAYPNLPVAQYPEIAPPTITVTATYPGASAEVIADTVATPLEQQINGVEDMLYMSSSSTSDGQLTITLTFKLGTDLNNAQVLVQNRVATAEPRLPEEVRRLGVVTNKASPDLLLVIHLYSPDGSRDAEYISNYVTLQIRDKLARLDGVGDARVFGARDYAMRIWIDPDKAAAHNLTAGDIVGVLQAQNVQVAAGAVGQPPFGATGSDFELNINTLGRLTQPEQFANIILKTDADGRVTRVRDVARTELGAQDYRLNAYLDRGQNAVAIGITQRPGSNALATAESVLTTMKGLAPDFPPGLKYTVIYNPTEYVAASIKEVRKTLFEAVLLVVLVVVVFLQTWRAAIIPVLAIPVSLIGAFAVMAGFGASLNSLSLFGLVLAIGIVVDDS
ncbi:MAG: efflux RND transporter permease subunit, partial [Phenylobacterium sp.]